MRRRWVYDKSGRAIEVTEDWTPEPRSEYHIMPDIKPYKSMIDGREITSRSKHREHLRANDCVEIGNDSSLSRPPKPIQSPPGLKEKIIEAVRQVKQRSRYGTSI